MAIDTDVTIAEEMIAGDMITSNQIRSSTIAYDTLASAKTEIIMGLDRTMVNNTDAGKTIVSIAITSEVVGTISIARETVFATDSRIAVETVAANTAIYLSTYQQTVAKDSKTRFQPQDLMNDLEAIFTNGRFEMVAGNNTHDRCHLSNRDTFTAADA